MEQKAIKFMKQKRRQGNKMGMGGGSGIGEKQTMEERLVAWDQQKTNELIHNPSEVIGDVVRGIMKEQIFTHLGTFGKPLKNLIKHNESGRTFAPFYGRLIGAVYDSKMIDAAINGNETAKDYLAIRGAIIGASLLINLGKGLARYNPMKNSEATE